MAREIAERQAMKNNCTVTKLSSLLLPLVLVACGDGEGDTDETLVVRASSTAVASSASTGANVFGETFAGSPTLLQVTVFGFYVSANEDCSNAQLVDEKAAAGEDIDVYQNPIMFEASPEDGAYPCVIIKQYDQLTTKVDQVAADAFLGCDTSTTYTGDLYRDGGEADGLWKDVDGNGIDATGSDAAPGADFMYVMASTSTDAVINGPIGAHPSQTIPLTNAMQVPGMITFYVDFNDGVTGDDTRCAIEKGTVGFR